VTHTSNDADRQAVRRRPAYTLFELVVVVTIIGALAAIAVAPFARSMTIRQADAAANRVAADLLLARQHAIRTSATQTVAFVLPDRYTLSGLTSMDRTGALYEVNLAAEPYATRITAADFDGDLNAVFDGFGVPVDAGYVTVQAGSQQRTIALDAAGKIVITEP